MPKTKEKFQNNAEHCRKYASSLNNLCSHFQMYSEAQLKASLNQTSEIIFSSNKLILNFCHYLISIYLFNSMHKRRNTKKSCADWLLELHSLCTPVWKKPIHW